MLYSFPHTKEILKQFIKINTKNRRLGKINKRESLIHKIHVICVCIAQPLYEVDKIIFKTTIPSIVEGAGKWALMIEK